MQAKGEKNIFIFERSVSQDQKYVISPLHGPVAGRYCDETIGILYCVIQKLLFVNNIFHEDDFFKLILDLFLALNAFG